MSPLRAPNLEFAHDQSAGKNAARQRRSSGISKGSLEPIAYEFRSTQKIRSQALQNRPAFFILTLRRIQTGNTRQPIQRPGDFGR